MKIIFRRILSDVKNARLGFLAFGLYWCYTRLLYGEFCPLVIALGVPCPGCGITRACESLVKLDIYAAMAYNPSVFLWLFLAVYFFTFRYLLGKKVPGKKIVLAVVGSLTLICYIYRMILFFPGNPPLEYKEGNILANISLIYNDFMKSL